MSPKRKILLTTTAAVLAGLALIKFPPQTSSDPARPQPQSRAGASPKGLQTNPQSWRDAAGSQVAASTAAGPHAQQTPPNAGNAESDSVLDKQLTEVEQKSLWQALSEARREVREIPETWAKRPENLGYDFYALHPKQQLTARFGAGAVQLVSSERSYTEIDAKQPTTAWEARMSLQSFAGGEVAAEAAAEKVAGNRVEYQRAAGLTEWFDNGTEAMEHGFTVTGRPGHLAANDEVVLEMRLDGLAAAQGDADGQRLAFLDGGREVLSYEKLLVFDAEGKELPARMEPTEDGFLIAYHDAGATYPVTVDPLLVNPERKFNGIDGAPNDQFGISVSVSGDTVVAGADRDDDGGTDSGSAYVFKRSGSNWTLQTKLTASDAAAGDWFGYSVAISGDTVIVGAHQNDDGGSNSGSAYVFTRSGNSWSEQGKLIASDDAAGDQFGISVSVSGETVVVGADQDDDGGGNSGSAYVFTQSGSNWTQQQKLTASDAAASDQFGISVSISGDTVVAGAYQDDAARGSAYVFTRSVSGNWTQQRKLTASDAVGSDWFGYSVAVSGDTVIVGSPRDDDKGNASGSAYVFTRSGGIWSQQAKLTASDGAEADQLGFSVSVSGDTAVAGAYQDDAGATDSGSAYVFTRAGNNWNQQARLIVLDAAASDRLGISVAISGDTVVAGADQDDNSNGGSNSGSASVYTRSGNAWTLQTRLTASDAAANDQFGGSVAISGNTVVVGANLDDDGGTDSGSAYVFFRSGSTWKQQAKLTASDAAANDSFGSSVSVSGDSVVIGAWGDDTTKGSDVGSAYVFTRSASSWSQQEKLTDPDGAQNEWFGWSVSLFRETLVVGAIKDNDEGANSGSATVFTRFGSTWSRQAKLISSGASLSDQFGYSVSIDWDTVVVGANLDDDVGANSGSAYVFTRDGSRWSEQAKLNAFDGSTDDRFGHSVSVSGDTIVVGAWGDDTGGDFNIGSAYVFTRSGSTWSHQARLIAGDRAAFDQFGYSVSVSGDTVVVGANLQGAGSTFDMGSAYVFTRSNGEWFQQTKLRPSDAAQSDNFGISVAISGDTVVAGSYFDDDGGTDSGSVYVYRLAETGVRKLLVADHLGNPLANGGTASPFQGQRIGTSRDYLFTVTNVGALGLDLQSISLGGPDASQFSLALPNLSAVPDLAQGESVTFTVTFKPVGNSGTRNASLLITSDDPDYSPSYSASLPGLGLSNGQDGDNDGMNDWAEYDLRGFGFDWQATQTNLVSDYYGKAPSAGLVTLDQVAGLTAGAALLEVDWSSNRAKIAIQLKQSGSLTPPFAPIVADPARLSVDALGRIVYEVDAPAPRRFYTMTVEP